MPMFCYRDWVSKALKNIRSDTKAIRAAVEMSNTQQEMIIRKLDNLGVKMAEVAEVLADLNDATNEVAGEIDVFNTTIADLIAQLANSNPEAVAQLEELKAGATAAASRLRGLAADPEVPVPPVDDNPPAVPDL